MDLIIAALAGNKKIEAIKLYREATGVGLKEAKDFIETLVSQLAEQDPERFSKAVGYGCSSVFLLALIASSSIVYWMLA